MSPTFRPRPKVAAAGIGGSAAVLVLYMLGLFGVAVEPEVAAAIATLASFLAGYFRADRPGG